MYASLNYLLLQMRNADDPMRQHEVRCFARFLHSSPEQIRVVDLLQRRPTASQLDEADIVLLGGSGDYSVAEGGPWLEQSKTKNGDRFIDQDRPYGRGSFGGIGAFARVQFDTRRSWVDEKDFALPLHENPAAGYPTSGFLIDVTSEVSPPVWDVEETWGAIEGSVSGHWSAGERDRGTLALRIGGRETWG